MSLRMVRTTRSFWLGQSSSGCSRRMGISCGLRTGVITGAWVLIIRLPSHFGDKLHHFQQQLPAYRLGADHQRARHLPVYLPEIILRYHEARGVCWCNDDRSQRHHHGRHEGPIPFLPQFIMLPDVIVHGPQLINAERSQNVKRGQV